MKHNSHNTRMHLKQNFEQRIHTREYVLDGFIYERYPNGQNCFDQDNVYPQQGVIKTGKDKKRPCNALFLDLDAEYR